MFPPRPTVWRAAFDTVRGGRHGFRRRAYTAVRVGYASASVPLAAWFLFLSRAIHPEHRKPWWRVLRLALRLRRNTTRVFCGTSPTAHLAMAVKLLELPPGTPGVVVECGSFLGGSTANLSIVCDFVDRDLVVYDSFEGLPEPEDADRFAVAGGEGLFFGDLETVRGNVRRHGVISRCTFRKGWFDETLPDHTEPIALAYLDVDHEASIHTCLVNLWPHLVDGGFLFTDDYMPVAVASVFFNDTFWAEQFDEKPPGLMGAGTGIGLGQFWLGPYKSLGDAPDYPLQSANSTAYTRKGSDGSWTYTPRGAKVDKLVEADYSRVLGEPADTTTSSAAGAASADERVD